MKRRTFLLFSIIIMITKGFAAHRKSNEIDTIKAVFNHLFPTTSKYNGAHKFGAFDFLMFVSKHPTFDKDDLEFILRGARKLNEFSKNFLNLPKKEKEKTLREFEKLTIGQNWLSTLLYYGFEAMLSDPIYKGNKNMTGWKNISHTTPIPTASKPFGELS